MQSLFIPYLTLSYLLYSTVGAGSVSLEEKHLE